MSFKSHVCAWSPIIVLELIDYAMTMFGMRIGGREGNPLMVGVVCDPVAALLFKVGLSVFALVFVYTMTRLCEHFNQPLGLYEYMPYDACILINALVLGGNGNALISLL